jgi:hypothetical protein
MILWNSNTPSRLIAFCAAAGILCIFVLRDFLASPALGALFLLGLLGGYAAARLGRGGIRWTLFGLLTFGLFFFLLSVLPVGKRTESLAHRVPPRLLTPVALALLSLFIWLSTLDSSHWFDARTEDSIKSFESFLAKRPNSPHADEARARLSKLRPKKERLQAWLKNVRESPDLETLFSPDNENAATFKPKFFLVNVPGPTPPEWLVPRQSDVTSDYSGATIAKTIESAQTLALVRTVSEETGQQYTDGTSLWAWTVTVCLVDTENLQRRRVLKAESQSPPKIVGNEMVGGHYTINGAMYDGSKSQPELLEAMLERVVEQNQ